MAISNFTDIHADFGDVPQSKGVPVVVHLASVVGLLVIFLIAAAVVLNAGFGHQWPSEHTTRSDLGTMPK
jgi:hypothetical protein